MRDFYAIPEFWALLTLGLILVAAGILTIILQDDAARQARKRQVELAERLSLERVRRTRARHSDAEYMLSTQRPEPYCDVA